ncbi:MAG: hypothetical protein NVS3B1_16440 [Marmoricola sp.]
MPASEDLGTEYHQQDTNYYCGAASAQMVLQSCGSGHIDQVSLYNDNHSHSTTESGWATAPDGLQWTLNNRQSGHYFCLDALDTEDAISRMITWTIHDWRVAPVPMVYGWAHWIVVRGYQASAAPTSPFDTSYTISGFDVNNPWPPTPAGAAEPPHLTGDGCGSGGDRGVANEYISYATWQTDYMTGIPSGHWAGKFVAVCDPAPPQIVHPVVRAEIRRKHHGDDLLSAKMAGTFSREHLEETGLLHRENWAEALEGTEAGEAVLVQRLDHVDSFYWIVPQHRDGRVTSVVNLDALTGNFREARAMANEGETALLTLESREVDERVFGLLHDLGDYEGQLRLRPKIGCISRHWVWKPCDQSLSPYYPFKMVSYGAHRLYVRSDGAVFTQLTNHGRGI